MVKEPHFTPARMLSMLGLKSDSLGRYALIPGPKERSDMIRGLLENPKKNFSFLDYEMHTGGYGGQNGTLRHRGGRPRHGDHDRSPLRRRRRDPRAHRQLRLASGKNQGRRPRHRDRRAPRRGDDGGLRREEIFDRLAWGRG